MTDNQPKLRYREFTQNTRKVARSAFGKLLHEEFLTPHKITQRRLSEVSGVAAEDVSRMVTGERYPYDPTLYNNLYALFKALAELKVSITEDQVNNVLQVKEIHARLSGKRQEELIDALKDEGVVKVAYQTTQQEADSPYWSAGQAPESPWIDNLPFRQNPFFTGRETELEQLRKQLQETGTATITQPVSKSVSISGLGGIGKTELALEYAHRYYPDVYHTVLWVVADTTTIQASYANLAEILKLPERNEQELYRRIQAVKNWLKDHTCWLLIMDNADDLSLAESFLPAKPLGHVVFTTQSQIIGTTATLDRQIEIEGMRSNDGLRLLLLRSHRLEYDAPLDSVAPDIHEAALQVVELLGEHPLALDQAGAYIEGTGVSFADYVERYHNERHRLLNRRNSLKSKDSDYSRHPVPVAATLMLSIEEAAKQYPLSIAILAFCAFLLPDVIPEELFQHVASLKYGTTIFDDAIAALQQFSLIKCNKQNKTFSIHRLVQAVLIESMPPDLQKQWRESVARAVNALFPSSEWGNWEFCERLQSHVLAFADWTDDELTPTLEVADLFFKASIYLISASQYSESERLLARVHSIYEQHFGAEHPEHPDTARSLYVLATIYLRQDRYALAGLLFLRAITIWDKYPEAEHPESALPLWGLAVVKRRLGHHERAKELYQRTISIHEHHLGAMHPDVQIYKRVYAEFLHSLGRDAETAALDENDEPSE